MQGESTGHSPNLPAISVDPGPANSGYCFIDSGSNALFFQDAGIPGCSSNNAAGFYCPASTQDLSATIPDGSGPYVAF